ncbi:ribonuclease PH [bacterium]|nr:ribonuclease PH [bacterium]
MQRIDGRKIDELRKVRFEPHFAPNAEGSVLVHCGNTKVLCTATLEHRTPKWMAAEEGTGGWITAEYSMLPRSTTTRVRRERNGAKGRTQEIQRLIGRSLRASVNLELLGGKTILIDCDVIQADGGTRTASITGGYIALLLALLPEIENESISKDVLRAPVAAISAGIVENSPVLDLCYEEDVRAEVDANFVLTGEGNIVEVQGTAEGKTISKKDFDELFSLAHQGITHLINLQKETLKQYGL